MPMSADERVFVNKGLKLARERGDIFMVGLMEYVLEHDLGPDEIDDRVTQRVVHRVARRNIGALVPQGLGGICIVRDGATDPQDFLVVSVCNCNDGDLHVARSKGDHFEDSYLVVPERRKAPVPLSYAELQLAAVFIAAELGPRAPSAWKHHLEDLSRRWNEIVAAFEDRKGKTPDA